MKKYESINYRNILAAYYFELLAELNGIQNSEQCFVMDHLRHCERSLATASKLPTPARELEFTRAILDTSLPIARYAA